MDSRDTLIHFYTNDSGKFSICRYRRAFNVAAVHRSIKYLLSQGHCWTGCEWPYWDVALRFIGEEFLSFPEGQNGTEAVEGDDFYKFICFGGSRRSSSVRLIGFQAIPSSASLTLNGIVCHLATGIPALDLSRRSMNGARRYSRMRGLTLKGCRGFRMISARSSVRSALEKWPFTVGAEWFPSYR